MAQGQLKSQGCLHGFALLIALAASEHAVSDSLGDILGAAPIHVLFRRPEKVPGGD